MNIRNFSIIAHIDHGKSTLADRIIELCGGLSSREMTSQVLDTLDLEKERGITIKAQTVSLSYTAKNGEIYQFNLIDTPGHVDFSYEVSRSLSACEGAILLVDASQGVEAQTLSTCYSAVEEGVTIIPVLNKLDLDQSDPERVRKEIEEIIGVDASEAPCISAKMGTGIEDVLEQVVSLIPAPEVLKEEPLQASIIDYWFDNYLGVVSLVRVVRGNIKKGDLICKWDPYNAVIISDVEGEVKFVNLEEGITFRSEVDEQTGFSEMVVKENRDKKKIPTLSIVDKKDEELKYFNLPVDAHIIVKEGQKLVAGDILVKIPRKAGKSGDITGGLPRVTEMFEARNPSNPAVVAQIDGVVSYGKIKRGNREVIIEAKSGEITKYLVPLSRHILVQENDYVKAGSLLSDGATTPADILSIKGPTAVQEYIVNEIQEVYRLQGVKINDKHFEVIVRQMMRKVEIVDAGDTRFLEKTSVNKWEFLEENDNMWGMKVIEDAGESEILQPGQIISARKLRDENSSLKRKDMKGAEARDAVPATANPVLQGITRASLQTDSFISAASFQETTKVLNQAAVNGKEDVLRGLKENVIVGHKIPAGTGMRQFQDLLVGSKEEYNRLVGEDEDVTIGSLK